MQWEKSIDDLVQETQEAAKALAQETVLGMPEAASLMKLLAQRWRDQRLQKRRDARCVRFQGGWGGVAKACGYRQEQNGLFQAIACAGASVSLKIGTQRHGGLWTWTYVRPSRTIRIIVGLQLAPPPL